MSDFERISMDPAKTPDIDRKAVQSMEPTPQKKRQRAEVAPVPPEKQLRILLVEDEEISQEVAMRVLRRRGHAIKSAASGQQALDLWKEHRDHLDIIVTDISMPDMGGVELAQQIRVLEAEGSSRIPIVAMTANAMKGDTDRYLAAGMDSYVAKPIRPIDFLGMIEDLVATGECSPAPASPQETVESEKSVCRVEDVLAAYDQDLLFVGEIVDLFFELYREEFPRIQAALDQQDLPVLAQRVHRVKSSIGNLKGEAMRAAAEALEYQARAGEQAGLDQLVAKLDAEFQRVKPVLEGIVRGEFTP